MRLTRFTGFGPSALVRLVSAPDCAFAMAEIDDEVGISRDHLDKVSQRVARHGLPAPARRPRRLRSAR